MGHPRENKTMHEAQFSRLIFPDPTFEGPLGNRQGCHPSMVARYSGSMGLPAMPAVLASAK